MQHTRKAYRLANMMEILHNVERRSTTKSELVGLVRRQQSCIDGLQATGTRQAAHQPVVDASHMVGVHARQTTHRIAGSEFQHTDDTFARVVL